MPNKKLLIEYYNQLCDVLNNNGYRIETYFRGEEGQMEYYTDMDHPDLTIMGITEDAKAYRFLQSKNLIRKDLCHFCGDTIKSSIYTFTEPHNRIKINICRTCHSKGQREQQVYRDMSSRRGCILFLPVLMLSIFR